MIVKIRQLNVRVCVRVGAAYMLKFQEVKMAVVRNYARMRTFEAGEVMRVNIYPVRPVAKGRRAKREASRPCQVALNRRNSKNRFKDIAHLNFNKRVGGYRVSLDYDFFVEEFGRNPRKDEYDAYKAAYFRRLRLLYAAHGGELKYMVMTHVGRKVGRVHHHCIISVPPAGVTWDEIKELWTLGYDNYDPLRFRNGSIAGLTSYFFDGSVDEKWSCSKNCKRPSEVDYEDGSPASVRKVDGAITMSQAHYIDLHRDDIAYIQNLFPGYGVQSVAPKAELIGVSGTEYNLLPFDGPFVEIELYKISAADKRIKLRTPRGRVKPGVKV